MMIQNVRAHASIDQVMQLCEKEPSVTFLIRRLRADHSDIYKESVRMAYYTRLLAGGLGAGETEQLLLYRTALLADVGLMQVPDGDSEEHVKSFLQHPYASAALLSPLIAAGHIDRAAVLQHHENLDGSGYPDGLSAKKISRNAQILRVAGSFTILTRLDRRTGHILGGEEAVGELYRWSGIIFREQLVELAGKILK